tara:strand:- start:3162 stop:3389 length:228 start_codon:yes stop_codon:yes gene_type:complete
MFIINKMPKLKSRLKEREFYCVGQGKRCTAKAEDISVVEFKNGVFGLEAYLPRYDVVAYKFVKNSKVDTLVNKYN